MIFFMAMHAIHEIHEHAKWQGKKKAKQKRKRKEVRWRKLGFTALMLVFWGLMVTRI
jgi:hypothetical protein